MHRSATYSFRSPPPPYPMSPQSHLMNDSPIDRYSVIDTTGTASGRAISAALSVLRRAGISPVQFIAAIYNPDSMVPEYLPFQNSLHNSKSNRLEELLLNLWISGNAIRRRMSAWFRPHVIDSICTDIANEADAAKPLLHVDMSHISPEFIEAWNLESVMDKVFETMPTWTRVLNAATQSKRAAEKNKIRTPTIGRRIVTAQVLHMRSYRSCSIQVMIGLSLWSSGVTRQSLDYLSCASICPSYPTLLSSVPCALNYDNLVISRSVFVEQRPGEPAKVESWTFAMLNELHPGATFDKMLLEPMLARRQSAVDLTMHDIAPTNAQWDSILSQFCVRIMRTLTKHHKQFSNYDSSLDLKYPARRPLPLDTKTQTHCLFLIPHEEASISGQLRVQSNVITQLSFTEDSPFLSLFAWPLFGDLLTIVRARGCLGIRQGDINSWTRAETLQGAAGLGHLVMNLIWGLKQFHSGQIEDPSSLSHFFLLLDKSRLTGAKPDYHSLLSALDQVLDGLILNAWLLECGHDSLEAFAHTQPTSKQLLETAVRILQNFATPLSPELAAQDHVHQNARLLMRDLLYVAVIVDAISDGDFGRVKDCYSPICSIFRSLGCRNYSNEILHWYYNIKNV
ncbi:hypothetical protein FISHEDRAFT_74154 [Fistulina hepatica ATCC 64428]|uniref:DUF6589 domain-containing protein n=1 Tax=Fistulina hepatica ATCC 64428 TaxID=1128425 RepID=A0A0D7AC07_9AGAR|nr:hypothetical protein FISHEDRAFT_74154 [Fistulina hepatica ATCC 64428]